jgi:hypothetical protein
VFRLNNENEQKIKTTANSDASEYNEALHEWMNWKKFVVWLNLPISFYNLPVSQAHLIVFKWNNKKVQHDGFN